MSPLSDVASQPPGPRRLAVAAAWAKTLARSRSSTSLWELAKLGASAYSGIDVTVYCATTRAARVLQSQQLKDAGTLAEWSVFQLGMLPNVGEQTVTDILSSLLLACADSQPQMLDVARSPAEPEPPASVQVHHPVTPGADGQKRAGASLEVIQEEMLNRLDLAGGKMLLSKLLEELETNLGVTPREAVQVMNSKEFSRSGGWIMRAVVVGKPSAPQVEQSTSRDGPSGLRNRQGVVRPESGIMQEVRSTHPPEVFSEAKSPANTGKCFFGVLQWWFRLDTTPGLLGSLEVQVPTGVMALFEVQPGTRRDFNSGEIRVSWAGAQPSIGVAGALLRRLRPEVGDVIWLCPLGADKVHLRFARYPDDVSEVEEISFLAGLHPAAYDANVLLIRLANAIDKPDVRRWPELLSTLRERGDHDIVQLAEKLLGLSQPDELAAQLTRPMPAPTGPSAQPVWPVAQTIGSVQPAALDVPGDVLQTDVPNVPSVDELFKVLKGNRRG